MAFKPGDRVHWIDLDGDARRGAFQSSNGSGAAVVKPDKGADVVIVPEADLKLDGKD